MHVPPPPEQLASVVQNLVGVALQALTVISFGKLAQDVAASAAPEKSTKALETKRETRKFAKALPRTRKSCIDIRSRNIIVFFSPNNDPPGSKIERTSPPGSGHRPRKGKSQRQDTNPAGSGRRGALPLPLRKCGAGSRWSSPKKGRPKTGQRSRFVHILGEDCCSRANRLRVSNQKISETPHRGL